MNPKFEQYQIDQAKIEVVPSIKAEFHFVLNDCAKKLLEQGQLDTKEINDLEMVYQTTQDMESELAAVLDQYRSKDIITSHEFLIAINHFLTANQNGPDSTNAKMDLLGMTMLPEVFKETLQSISIPEHTKRFLTILYEKIYSSDGGVEE